MKTTILVFLAWLVLRISRAKASPTSMETLLNFIDKHLEVESSSFLENELLPQEVALLQLLAQTIQNDQGPLRRDVGTSDNFLEVCGFDVEKKLQKKGGKNKVGTLESKDQKWKEKVCFSPRSDILNYMLEVLEKYYQEYLL